MKLSTVTVEHVVVVVLVADDMPNLSNKTVPSLLFESWIPTISVVSEVVVVAYAAVLAVTVVTRIV